MITIDHILSAQERIAPFIRRTPTLPAIQMRDPGGLEGRVTLKLELLQAAGSFKARGAMNRLMTLSPERLENGLVTASGGNHGLAVARTAYVAGVKAKVFLPSNVAPDKVAKLKGWNAAVEIVGSVWDEANEAALAFAAETDATYVHPFSDPAVVAGQGTLGLEILDDMPDVDILLVAIGGGGLITGLSTAVKARRPEARVIGIEPVGSPTLRACLDAQRLVALDDVSTRVPTMACRRTDEAIFQVVSRNVDDIVLVTDDEMQEAARWLWFEFGIAADLSGAASIAALRTGRIPQAGNSHVCALICGAGADGIS
ncbi:threonine ammonia-lyase [Microvirga lenta]|uniref:threonine ammonia-lyase n=1 Tax=Microvirga lenta TaxID=2881337 RepID=UPI001CFC6ECC|nr:pyridoxal-phosphate dependent enzyme [Microvirga lenta]MCB5174148.1 pyridoxal-phosphate dependent enzyme [Microvirga lenta]